MWRHEGGGGKEHGVGDGDGWQSTMMNAVDGGGTTAVAAAVDGGGVDGAFFCTVFVTFS